MFSKLYKFSKFVMNLNSCSMDFGRDSFLLLVYIIWMPFTLIVNLSYYVQILKEIVFYKKCSPFYSKQCGLRMILVTRWFESLWEIVRWWVSIGLK